ncbi:MAG: glycosyltransferase involved in cell wall biosynthesis [Flavobacteriaceae bacterium]|jgi:glycosyltransferase involved in cell wall biosynthesis|uniref:glycosyltransferase family 4 protein n=1 Tax=Candidatus Marifrigoribacter sp. Uisw_064 TaxID=3230970 RepID=UPI003AD815C4
MKRVLIITYYWPPAGGPGVQRWLKFIAYFKEFGIEPIVYTPENPNYPIEDVNLINEIPTGIEVIKLPIKEPYRFAKILSKKKTKQISSGIITKKRPSIIERLMLWVRGNFFIPDARIGWVKPSINYLAKYIAQNPIDAIITTGPPHSMHLIGLALKRKTGLTWIADFRDPWTTIHYHKSLQLSNSSEKKHKQLEAEVLQNADQVIVTSPNTKIEFQFITKQPIEVITNGYDTNHEIELKLDDNFSLVHIGSLLSGRNPEVLWKVLSDLCEENEKFAQDFKLKLIGAVSNEVIVSLKNHQLVDKAEVIGYVSHEEALQFQHNAQLLLLIEMNLPETRSIIPGKLFEYLLAKRPIIALGPKGSDIEAIISETNAGRFFDYEDKSQLKKEIADSYQLFKEGKLIINSRGIEKYSRRELTREMAETINKNL